MSDIPFLILVFVSAVNLVLPLIAWVFRTSFPASFVMWLGGIIWLMMFLTNDNIDLGQQNTSQTYNNVTDTITNGYSCNCYAIRNPVTFEPTFFGIMFISMAMVYILIGVLAERGT